MSITESLSVLYSGIRVIGQTSRVVFAIVVICILAAYAKAFRMFLADFISLSPSSTICGMLDNCYTLNKPFIVKDIHTDRLYTRLVKVEPLRLHRGRKHLSGHSQPRDTLMK